MVDIILSKDEKIEKLEKKMIALEKKMNYNFSNVEKSFDMMKRILLELQGENKELKKDRDFLLGRYKEMLRQLELVGAVGKAVEPIKKEIKESAELIRDIAAEGFNDGKARIDSLFELVMNENRLTTKKAAERLGIDEKRIKYWALKLERQGLIKINESLGKTVLVKK